jgi:uncharacterized protein
MTVPAAIRSVLACPKCHGALADVDEGRSLGCPNCRLKYPVRDGIPVMLRDQATEWVPEVS